MVVIAVVDVILLPQTLVVSRARNRRCRRPLFDAPVSKVLLTCYDISMLPTEPESEDLRLAAMYSQMSDIQLQELAENSDDLTDIALRVLNTEIRRRGLNFDFDFEESSSVNEAEVGELITIRKFQNPSEAVIAKGALESAGIECFLNDSNIVEIDWLLSIAVGYVKLQVRREDAEAALAILDQSAEDTAAENEPQT
jgi:hypothetical protein